MPNKKNKPLRVVELFAGVGGFRLGLEGYNGKSASSNYKNSFSNDFRVIWSNQWEPSTNRQHANEVYLARWPEEECNYEHSQKNIEDEVDSVPEHDVLVGGFPCQDYSVATTLKNSKGLIGVKGVLWWSIYSILKKQGKKKPKYLTEINQNFLAQMMKQLNLNQYAKVGGQPSISQTTVYRLQIPLPPLSIQQEIVAQIEAEQEMVNANKKLIEIYEQKIKDKIGEVWGE